MIKTMTTAEAAETLRSLGLKISPETIREGLEQGKFPFGECIEKKNGRNVYHVYTKMFDDWISEREVLSEE